MTFPRRHGQGMEMEGEIARTRDQNGPTDQEDDHAECQELLVRLWERTGVEGVDDWIRVHFEKR